MQNITIRNRNNEIVYTASSSDYLFSKGLLRDTICQALNIEKYQYFKIIHGTSTRYTLEVTEPTVEMKEINFSLIGHDVGGRIYLATSDCRVFNKKDSGIFFEMKQSGNNSKGQPYLQLGINTTHNDVYASRAFPVHRLIALAYVETDDYSQEIDHIDGDRQNNTPENLQWLPKSANLARKSKYGTLISCYDKEGNLVNTYPSIVEAAKALDVTGAAIFHALRGKTKTCCKMIWRRD